MKTFDDLEFQRHPNYPYFKLQAKLHFENKYGVSVITGKNAYSHRDAEYEVGILFNDDLTDQTKYEDKIIGYQTAEEVSEIMAYLQKLKGTVFSQTPNNDEN